MFSSFSLSARRKLDELFVKFDNVIAVCQFHNAILYSSTCLSDLRSDVSVSASN